MSVRLRGRWLRRSARRRGRASLATMAVLVVALLLGGMQHCLRLCHASDHRAEVEPAHAAASACPDHARTSPSNEPVPGGGVPPCCAPVTSLVSLPSPRGLGDETVAQALQPSFLAWSPALSAPPFASMRRAAVLDDRVRDRGSGPYPHLRTHLALQTILA